MKGKTNKSWLMVFAAVAALTAAQKGRGITFGEPDNGRHPNVGAVMLVLPDLPNLPNPAQFLSGTLIAPNLFLSAGHGTAYLKWLMEAEVVTFNDVFVTFSDDPTDKSSYLRIKAIRTHPGYKSGKVTDVYWWDARGQGAIPIDDMALLVLEDVPTGIEPEALPPVGFLDELKQAGQLPPDTKILAVGYGRRATFRPSTPVGVYETHNRGFVLVSLARAFTFWQLPPRQSHRGAVCIGRQRYSRPRTGFAVACGRGSQAGRCGCFQTGFGPFSGRKGSGRTRAGAIRITTQWLTRTSRTSLPGQRRRCPAGEVYRAPPRFR